MTRQIILHTNSTALSDALVSVGHAVSPQNAEISEQDLLVLAFPDSIVDTAMARDIILDQSFDVLQRFVQTRMRKKSGDIVMLLDARCNGMSYGASDDDTYSLTFQGGLIGFAKTIVKEYGKKGLRANVVLVDWAKISMADVPALINVPTGISGQVYAADMGVYL